MSPSNEPRLDEILVRIRHLEKQSEPTVTDRMWAIVTRLAVPVVLGLVAFIYRLDSRVHRLEATRFTLQDAQAMTTQLRNEIRNAGGVPSSVAAALLRIEGALEGVREDIADVRDRVSRIEGQGPR